MSNSNPANPTTTTMSINNNSNQSTNQVNTNTSTTTNNPNQKDPQQQQQQQQQSQDPGQQTSIIELESQFILRMPVIKGENGAKRPHPATAALREALAEQSKINDEQEDPLKGRLFVEINPETRKGRVRFDDEVFDARLVDLPCIVESLKTKDKKMFYKTADICQMLVCKTRDDEWSDDDTSAEMAKAKKKGEVVTHAELLNRKYQWAHGITPPLKNVRRKRFRKVAKKRVIDYAEIEREVKQLFRTDREAANITYEVVYMEGEGPTASNEAGGEDNEGGLDNEEDANDRKTTTHKYDWDEDSMLSPDENSSSFMVRRTGKKSTAATASSLAGPSSSNNNKDMLKKDQSMLDLDESSSKATTAQSADQKQNREDTNMSASQQLDRSALDDRTKNYEDETIDDEASNLESTSNFKSMFVKEVLGDLSSSDEEDDEDEEEDDQNEDEEKANNEQSDDSNSNMESVASKSKSNYNEFEGEEENAAEEMDDDETMDDDENTNAGADFSSQGRSKSDELNTKLNKLYGDLHRIQEERVKREDEIKHISNPGLKVRLSSRLNNLIDEENKTKNEIEELKSLMEDQ